MLPPTVYELEQRFLPRLRERFACLSVEQEEDGEFSHVEIVLNEKRNWSVYLDAEALEIRVEYAFFRFLYGTADLLDYRVMGEQYDRLGADRLFQDAFSFLCFLAERPLAARYLLSGRRLLQFELLREEETIYRYRYIWLPVMPAFLHGARVITETVVL